MGDLSEHAAVTGTDSQNITVSNPGTRLLGCGVMFIAVAATLGGMFDPATGDDRLELLPGTFFLAVELVLLVRALRLGVTVTANAVTSRGWFRTRMLDRATITRVGTAGYSGLYNRGSTSSRYLMLEVISSGRSLELPNVAGSAAKVHRLADQLRTALDLPGRAST